MFVAGCAVPGSDLLRTVLDRPDTSLSRVALNPEHCEHLFADPVAAGGDGLDPGNIRLLSWNTQKGTKREWLSEFEGIRGDRTLVLLQEAIPEHYRRSHETQTPYRSFAPGFFSPSGLTGVLTLSAVEPLTQCHLENREPWLRTAKATNVTEYGLQGTEKTLAVVNVHAINFSLGIAAYAKQLEQIATVLDAHEGPVIVSGDFNTWSHNRLATLERMAHESGLKSLTIANDRRSTFFGYPVDHVFVRGLQTVAATTPAVTTSDHNPILAVFRLL